MYQDLRQVPLFASFTEEQFQSLITCCMDVNLEAGESLIKEGDAPSGLYVILEGEVEVTKRIGGQNVVLAHQAPGSFVGEISLLSGLPHMATVRATIPSRFVRFGPEMIQAALETSPLFRILLSTMAERLRHTEVMVQQHEKLSALGRMAAGLAHELNNPVSANLRAAKTLPDMLRTLYQLVFRINRLNMNPDQLSYLNEYQNELMERAAHASALDPLAQSDREDELAAWIEAQGIEDAWQITPALVEASVTNDELDTLKDHLGQETLQDVLKWLEGLLSVIGLLRTIEESSTRVHELVQAVKAYSYMDQSPQQEVDIHDGLDNTLMILGYKLKNITVTREYDRSLPHITVYGSELNQVWTNLIVNAIEAMNGHGRIWIRTACENDWLTVEIADDGPGIPSEIQSRIFEPFFTTKGIGQGTGLGLDITYRIVVDRHRGHIRVNSKPGDTRFKICLPLEHDPVKRVQTACG